MTYDVEYTDTFGGEANYGWVRRYEVAGKTDRQVMRRAKAAVGLTGVRGRVSRMCHGFAFYPYGSATVMFVTVAWEV